MGGCAGFCLSEGNGKERFDHELKSLGALFLSLFFHLNCERRVSGCIHNDRGVCSFLFLFFVSSYSSNTMPTFANHIMRAWSIGCSGVSAMDKSSSFSSKFGFCTKGAGQRGSPAPVLCCYGQLGRDGWEMSVCGQQHIFEYIWD